MGIGGNGGEVLDSTEQSEVMTRRMAICLLWVGGEIYEDERSNGDLDAVSRKDIEHRTNCLYSPDLIIHFIVVCKLNF
jgi:hypothetical protein